MATPSTRMTRSSSNKATEGAKIGDGEQGTHEKSVKLVITMKRTAAEAFSAPQESTTEPEEAAPPAKRQKTVRFAEELIEVLEFTPEPQSPESDFQLHFPRPQSGLQVFVPSPRNRRTLFNTTRQDILDVSRLADRIRSRPTSQQVQAFQQTQAVERVGLGQQAIQGGDQAQGVTDLMEEDEEAHQQPSLNIAERPDDDHLREIMRLCNRRLTQDQMQDLIEHAEKVRGVFFGWRD